MDGDHFGAAGDWTNDKTERLANDIVDLIKIAVRKAKAERNAAIARAGKAEAEVMRLKRELDAARKMVKDLHLVTGCEWRGGEGK